MLSAPIRSDAGFPALGGLCQAWQGRPQFVVLLSDFRAGEGFVALLKAWRQAGQNAPRLHLIGIVPVLRDAAAMQDTWRQQPASAELQALRSAWPVPTRNIHRLSFENGAVQLVIAPGRLRDVLPELSARVDAFCLSPPTSPDAAWGPEIYKAFARLSAPGAQVYCDTVPPDASWQALQAGLRASGFRILPQDTPTPSSAMALHEPRFVPRRAPARNLLPASSKKQALILGAGLAGSAAAWALAERGWDSRLIDRQPSPALETSGNPAGLFHGVVNPQDGHHARFNRAAALEAARVVTQALRRPGALGAVDGLLRIESQSDVSAMGAVLQQLGLPSTYVQALSAGQATARAGLALPSPAWFYPQGGWVRPADLMSFFLAEAASHCEFRAGLQAQGLRRHGTGWQLLDSKGETIDESEVLVLANAGDALRLLDSPGWPLSRVRGQLSSLDAGLLAGLPSLPLAGSGYLLPRVSGRAIFGATSQRDDEESGLRADDHRHNLAQLSRLTGWKLDALPMPSGGRTGWRCVADDRLPLIGGVPDRQAAAGEEVWDQARRVPRLPGLYVFTGLASRGITWAALGAQILASAIAGTPAPVESSLLDAVDPARFAVRGVRRRSSTAAG